MRTIAEERYIRAYANIMHLDVGEVIQYAEKRGISSLIENPAQLLSTEEQKEKFKAFLELYQLSQTFEKENDVLNTPQEVSDFVLSKMKRLYDQETMLTIFLDGQNRVIDYEETFIGTVNSCTVHPREIFRNAVVNKAAAIIISHNHPSGNITPSKEDVQMTQKLIWAGKLMNINMLDHVIVSGSNKNKFFSMKAEGLFCQLENNHKDIFKESHVNYKKEEEIEF